MPRRDYVILPLLSLLTVLLLLGGAELAARRVYADGPADACLTHDPSLGVSHRPNCTALVKVPESDWVANQYNACGYRTAEACGPTPAHARRIAVIGSSIAFGLYVPYPDSMTARLGQELSAACAQPVEVQNLASEFEFWTMLRRRFELAMALHPDALIVIVGPTDIETPDDELSGSQNELPPVDLMTKVRNLFADVRLRTVAQHFMYRDRDFYLSLYRNSVAKTLYMRSPLSPTLQTHLAVYEGMLADFGRRAGVSGIPVMLAYVPQRAQVGFAADPSRPTYIQPFALDTALAEAAGRDGMAFTDTTPDFVSDPRQMDLFLRSDGHLAASGDEVIAHSLARGLVGSLAPFKHCAASRLSARNG